MQLDFGFDPDECDFKAFYHTLPDRYIAIAKSDFIERNGEYYVNVPTRGLSAGTLKCTWVVRIPDETESKGYREERYLENTGITLIPESYGLH